MMVKIDAEAARDLLLEMPHMEKRLHDAGLHAAAHKMNEALNIAGWALAEKLEAKDQPHD